MRGCLARIILRRLFWLACVSCQLFQLCFTTNERTILKIICKCKSYPSGMSLFPLTFLLIFERVLPQSLRTCHCHGNYVFPLFFVFFFCLVGVGSNKWKPHWVCIPACAVHGTVDQNNSLANTSYKHTISGPTNDWSIYGWATGRANDWGTGDIGAGHEVCMRILSIFTRAPSYLSLVLRILLLTIVAVLI